MALARRRDVAERGRPRAAMRNPAGRRAFRKPQGKGQTMGQPFAQARVVEAIGNGRHRLRADRAQGHGQRDRGDAAVDDDNVKRPHRVPVS
ncbi:MAG: hypothetical protein H6851_09585 [Geminicoccaceae bacterium]|nr:hypothetical protein [Geminicoccaceae bacterium]